MNKYKVIELWQTNVDEWKGKLNDGRYVYVYHDKVNEKLDVQVMEDVVDLSRLRGMYVYQEDCKGPIDLKLDDLKNLIYVLEINCELQTNRSSWGPFEEYSPRVEVLYRERVKLEQEESKLRAKLLEWECERNPELKRAVNEVCKILTQPVAYGFDYEKICKELVKVEQRKKDRNQMDLLTTVINNEEEKNERAY